MFINRSIFDEKPQYNARKIKIPKSFKKSKTQERPIENEDHKQIREVLIERFNMPQDFKIEVSNREPLKIKDQDTLKLIPQYRATIWGRNFGKHCGSMGLYIYKSFWVTKADGKFQFKKD